MKKGSLTLYDSVLELIKILAKKDKSRRCNEHIQSSWWNISGWDSGWATITENSVFIQWSVFNN